MGLSEFFGCVLPARPAREFSPKEERLGLGERGYSMVFVSASPRRSSGSAWSVEL